MTAFAPCTGCRSSTGTRSLRTIDESEPCRRLSQASVMYGSVRIQQPSSSKWGKTRSSERKLQSESDSVSNCRRSKRLKSSKLSDHGGHFKHLKNQQSVGSPGWIRTSNPSVNGNLSNFITICRSGSFPRRISKLR
jgi:hypothetical protein